MTSSFMRVPFVFSNKSAPMSQQQVVRDSTSSSTNPGRASHPPAHLYPSLPSEEETMCDHDDEEDDILAALGVPPAKPKANKASPKTSNKPPRPPAPSAGRRNTSPAVVTHTEMSNQASPVAKQS